MKNCVRTITLISALLFHAGHVSAQTGFPTPEEQQCNLLAGTVAATAVWRDNKVPLAKAQGNVDHVVMDIPGATAEDSKKWRDTVAAIYKSNFTPDQIQEKLQSYCH